MIDPDYFAKKRAQLGMDREDQLVRIQAVLNSWYPAQVRAKRLHQGVLRVVTPSAAVASELRLRQLELAQSCGLGPEIRVAISIGTMS